MQFTCLGPSLITLTCGPRRRGPGELSTRLPAGERGAARAEITPGEGASCIPVLEVFEGGAPARCPVDWGEQSPVPLGEQSQGLG